MTNQLSGRTLLAWGGRPASYCWQNLPDSAHARARSPVALGTLLMVAGILVLLLYMVRVGERRWRAAGMALDGARPAEEDA